MRLLLLLLLALGSALAMPFAIYGTQPELLPEGGSVSQAWADLGEVVRLLRDAQRTGREPTEPGWDDARVRRALTVGATAAVWLVGFLPGGIAGLLMLHVRRMVLAVVAVVVALALYSCTKVQVTHDLAPETVVLVKRFVGLALAAALAGFLTARSFRRTVL